MTVTQAAGISAPSEECVKAKTSGMSKRSQLHVEYVFQGPDD